MSKTLIFANDLRQAQEALKRIDTRVMADVLLIACPPHLSRHASRWLSRASRAQWQTRWADQLQSALGPLLCTSAKLETRLAQQPLATIVARTRAHEGVALQVLDLRAAHVGAPLEPLTPTPIRPSFAWRGPLVVTSGISAILTWVD